MSNDHHNDDGQIDRREFLKLMGMGAVSTTALSTNIAKALAIPNAFGGPLSQTIPSPNRTLRVMITPVGREHRESRVEIQKSDGTPLCVQNYSSPDGEHGLGVTENRWTTDSRFFVYSTSSSGGHQPYHARTFFYDRRTDTYPRHRGADTWNDGRPPARPRV